MLTTSRMIGLSGVGVLALLAGCSSYIPPEMQVVEATVTERSGDGVALAFALDAANTNDKPLPLRQAKYTLELDGKTVFSGERSAEATVPQHGDQRFVLPAGVPAGLVPAGVGAGGTVRYRLSGWVEYVIPGAFSEVLFDTGVRRPTRAFASEGTLELGAGAP